MNIPNPPVAGEGLSALWGRQVVECLRALRPSSGTGILVNTTANGTTYSVVPSRGAGLAWPWGDRWMWGIEVSAAIVADVAVATFTLHRPAVYSRGGILPAVVHDAGEVFATYEGIPTDREWGVAVDLDWSDADVPAGAELVLLDSGEGDSEDDLLTQPAGTETTTPERIPVAWFDGASLLRYWAPGRVHVPQNWEGPA